MGRLGVGLVALACLSMAITAASAECLPAAVSTGDPALVQSLGERLTANGIAITSTDGCPVVRVRVERRGEQLVLEMMDSFSRRARREVRDVATAAAIIESWTRQEIEEGTLPEPATSITTHPRVSSVAVVANYRTGVAATFESSMADNGSLWLGGSIAGCAKIGPTCIGGIVRGARDTHASGDTSGTSPHHGEELDAIATLDLPRRLGSFIVSPGIGIGYGWLAVTTSHLDMHMMPISVAETSHALRVDVHLMITRPLGRRFALFGVVHGDAALARTDIAADGPRSFARAAIGIRLEAP